MELMYNKDIQKILDLEKKIDRIYKKEENIRMRINKLQKQRYVYLDQIALTQLKINKLKEDDN
jgi:hypothetical protein